MCVGREGDRESICKNQFVEIIVVVSCNTVSSHREVTTTRQVQTTKKKE